MFRFVMLKKVTLPLCEDWPGAGKLEAGTPWESVEMVQRERTRPEQRQWPWGWRGRSTLGTFSEGSSHRACDWGQVGVRDDAQVSPAA